MIVDTSAVVAVVLGEDGHEAVLEALSSSDRKLMSAPTYVELRAVGARRLDVEGCRLLERFLREALIEVVISVQDKPRSPHERMRITVGGAVIQLG